MQNNRILVVDDEPIVRESIRDWLKDAGYIVSAVESGEEAIDLVQKETFCIVVLDVRLPGKTGITILKELREIKPKLRSILITAYPSVDLQAEAIKLGAIDYLIKPVAPDELEKLIKETIKKCESEEIGG